MGAKYSTAPIPLKQSKPRLSLPIGLLQRRCACGGTPGLDGECEACRRKRLLGPAGQPLRPKLAINQPGDPYELEADRVAAQVMTPSLLLSRPQLQRAAATPTGLPSAPPIVHEVLSSPGRPLDPASRALFEPRFGHDFSRVRLHTEAKAAESARAVKALAYTVGQDVVFGAGQYAPQTEAGRKLLAHELTHVVQQGDSPPLSPATLAIGAVNDHSEHEAEQAAHAAVNGRLAHLTPSPPKLQRQSDPDDPNRNVGPPLEEVPLPPRCSFVWEGGKPHIKCEDLPLPSPLPKSTPNIPILPKDWPKPGDLFPKSADDPCRGLSGFKPGGSKEFKGQCCRGSESKENCCPPFRVASKDLRCCSNDEVVQDGHCVKSTSIPSVSLCLPDQRTSTGFCCPPLFVASGSACVPRSTTWLQPSPPTHPPQPLPSIRPIGVLWIDPVTFEHDRPAPGTTKLPGNVTTVGAQAIESILSWLKLDPTLRVRLIGHTSAEGEATHNLELSKRRVQLVRDRITAAGFAKQIADPFLSDGNEQGCTAMGAGLWACGDQRATPGEVRPEERRVDVTFIRNLDALSQEPLKLTPPELKRP